MSGSKAALKAINAAVKAQKYDDAIQEAQKLLGSDPKNYQAYVVSYCSDFASGIFRYEEFCCVTSNLHLLG